MVVDLRGTRVDVGDMIAAAVREFNTGELRIGTVMAFGKRGANDTLHIRWAKESPDRYMDKTSVIEAHHARFVVIEGV
jgi:hypothetical protein